MQSALVSGVRASPILPLAHQPLALSPDDKPWHVGEGARIDDDGNLIPYGGPIASPP